jgi:hypothetical protein
MNKILISALFVIMFSSICFAQNDWKTGYIIKNQGDTIYGFIDNRDSKSNSMHCYFRKNANEEVQLFEPKYLTGYRIDDGNFYITKTVEKSGVDTLIFLEFLVQGKVNVYHTRDDVDRYYVEKDSKLYELKDTEMKRSIYDTDTTTASRYTVYLENKKEYVGILTVLMQDGDIQSDISKSSLETKSLIKIAKEYHEKVCTSEKCIIYEKSIKPAHITKVIYTGISLNNLNFGGRVISDYAFGSLLGLRLEFENAIEWNENLSIVLDFTLHHFTNYRLKQNSKSDRAVVFYNDVSYLLDRNATYIAEHTKSFLDVDIKTIALDIPITMNYTFSKGKVRPYIGAGIDNVLVLSQNNKVEIYDDENRKSIPIYQFGLIGRAGGKYMFKNNKSLCFELSYQYVQNISVSQFHRFTNSLLSFTLGYAF